MGQFTCTSLLRSADETRPYQKMIFFLLLITFLGQCTKASLSYSVDKSGPVEEMLVYILKLITFLGQCSKTSLSYNADEAAWAM